MPRRFPPVAPTHFGRDHFSLLAYLFTLVVCKDGRPQAGKLRTDGEHYPTRLAGGVCFPGHNDLDALADLEAAGVLQNKGSDDAPQVEFTPEGAKLGAWLTTALQAGSIRTSTLTWSQALTASGAALPNPEASAWPTPIPGPDCATCDGQGCPACREEPGPSPEYLE